MYKGCRFKVLQCFYEFQYRFGAPLIGVIAGEQWYKHKKHGECQRWDLNLFLWLLIDTNNQNTLKWSKNWIWATFLTVSWRWRRAEDVLFILPLTPFSFRKLGLSLVRLRLAFWMMIYEQECCDVSWQSWLSRVWTDLRSAGLAGSVSEGRSSFIWAHLTDGMENAEPRCLFMKPMSASSFDGVSSHASV